MNDLSRNGRITFSNRIKGLTNYSAICYANASFQVLFSTKSFRLFINTLTIDDSLHQFAARYFDSNGARVTSSKFYNNMEIAAPEGESDDLESFFTRLLHKYNGLERVFGIYVTNLDGTRICRAFLGSERMETIQ